MDLLWGHHPPGHPPRHVRFRPRPRHQDRQFIDGWNDRCEPFVWTKDADTILAKIDRKSSSETRH